MNPDDRQPLAVLLLSLLLGVLSNYLFFSEPLGVSYPAFVAVFYGAFFYCFRGRLKFEFKFGWIMLLPIFLLSMTYFLFSNEIFFTLNFLAVPFLIVIQTVLVTGANTYGWESPWFAVDVLYGCFYRTIGCMGKPFSRIKGLLPAARAEENPRGTVVKKVLLGVLISVPLVAFLAALLSSADIIFENIISCIPDLFAGIRIDEIIARSVWIAAVFVFSAAYIFSLLEGKRPAPDTWKSSFKGFEPVVFATVLIIVNALYIFFVAIQFAYLFGGIKYELPPEFTYSEYARRGFFELLVVSIINFCILSLSINSTKTDNAAFVIFHKILNSVLVACTAVILISAYYRMLLYEEAYGFTYLRVLTQAFMIFILVLLVIMAFKIWKTGTNIFKLYVITAITAFVLINYVNVDMIIVRNNIERFRQTGSLDVQYISSLSYDAVPELAGLYGDLDESMRIEADKILKNKKVQLERGMSWKSFNLSRHKASLHLEKWASDFGTATTGN